MAAGTRIKFVFNTADGTTTHNINYANIDATQANITACANAFITNGDIFTRVPLSVKEVTMITTTETDKTPQA